MAVLAGGGSHASWFVGHGEGRLSVGGRYRLWAAHGGGDRSWAVAVVVVVVACVLSWALVLAWLVTWPAMSLSSWLVVVVSGW